MMQTTSNGRDLQGNDLDGQRKPNQVSGTDETAVSPGPSGVLRRQTNGQKQMDFRGNHLLDFEDNQRTEETDRITESSTDKASIESRNGEYLEDDDGRSSACSEAIYCETDFSSLPLDLPTKYSTWDRGFKLRKAESLLELLEKQHRESVGNRLKELHQTNKRQSLTSSTINEMPIIAKRNPSKESILPNLPKQIRKSSYQPVIVAPFFSRSVSKVRPRLLGLGFDERERRSSITGQRVQTRSFFPLRETESLSEINHFVGRSEFSKDPGRPQDSSDRGSEGEVSSADDAAKGAKSSQNSELQPLEMTKSCNDGVAPTTKYDNQQQHITNGIKRERIFNEEEKSLRETDWFKESEVQNEETRSLPADPLSLPSVSNGSVSNQKKQPFSPVSKSAFSVSHSANHSSDNRNKWPSSSSSSSSCDTDNEIRDSDFVTNEKSEPIQFYRDDETLVCISKTSERNLTDSVTIANSVQNTSTRALNVNEDVVQKGEPGSANGIRKYYSDIHFQLKEPDPIFPVNYGRRDEISTKNGNVPNTSSSKDGEDDDDESDADTPENVTPNWSSYPGPLLHHAPGPDDRDFEPEPIEPPKRNISTLDIKVNLVKEVNNAKDRLNTDCTVQKISPSPTKPDDQISKTRMKDSESNDFSYVHLSTADAVGLSNADEQPPRSNHPNDHQHSSDDNRWSHSSTERLEAFLVESYSTDTRTCTLPRHWRPRNPGNPTTPRSNFFDGCFQEKDKNNLASHNKESSTLAGRGRQEMPRGNITKETDVVRPFHSEQRSSRPRADRQEARSNVTAGERISDSGRHCYSSSVTRTEDQRTDEKHLKNARRSFEKTPPSVERIWESVEEPRPRSLRRKIRFEFESGSTSTTDQSPPQRTWTSRYDGAEKPIRSASTETGGGVRHHQGTVPDGTDEYSVLEIEVPKGGLGLGFCIEGGKDGPYGDRPITVKRLFRSSSDSIASGAGGATLRPGDEIVSANGRDMTLLSRYVAWNYLKTLPEGTIKLVVRRRQQ